MGLRAVTGTSAIDFDGINASALAAYPGLLFKWFPQGRAAGHEFQVGNLRGDPGDSLSINVDTGVWKDFAAGEKGGRDPVSLYAAIHGLEQAKAALQLAAEIGAPRSDVIDLPKRQPERKQDKRPIIPVPADAPEMRFRLPGKGAPTAVWAYRARTGELLGYTARFDFQNPQGEPAKDILPILFCELADGKRAWRSKGFPEPRPLYGLHAVDAAPASAPWFFFEGEKKADAAALLLPGVAALSWPGGAEAVDKVDWTPANSHDCVIWGDADEAGQKAVLKAYARLRKAGAASVQMIDVAGQPSKWDIADALKDGWTAERTQAFVRERIRPVLAEIGGKPTASATQPLPAGEADREPADGPVPLGYDRGVYFYLSRADGQVHELTAGGHTKLRLMSLASLPHYWERTRFFDRKMDWDAAADDLMGKCQQVGVFRQDRLRGCGAWMDDGRVVLHLGDHLVVDGRDNGGLILEGSGFVYERRYPLHHGHAKPASAVAAAKFLELCCAPSWSHSLSGYLLAGWCVVAPICGALRWRPSIWITGASGAGKGWVIANIVRRLLAGVAVFIEGDTSDKGIEQYLGRDARPVVFDEAEGDFQRQQDRLQQILFLTRVASSSESGLQLKGTMDGRGRSSQIHTCFAFASINPSVRQHADESRVTTLTLQRNDDAATFALIKAKRDEAMPRGAADAILARVYAMVPVISDNLEAFSDAATEAFGSRRLGDQIGSLLAGAFALTSSKVVDSGFAREWIRTRNFGEFTAAHAEADEIKLLRTIAAHQARVGLGHGNNIDRTIGELVAAAQGKDESLPRETAEQHLRRFGLRSMPEGLAVSTTHPSIRKYLLRDTAWAPKWRDGLMRLPGALPAEKNVRFGPANSSPAVILPYALFE